MPPRIARSDPPRRLAAVALLVVGSLQMAGVLASSPALMRVGRALVAAPLPLVFSRVGDLETFSQRFELRLELGSGGGIRRVGDRELAARLGGSFTRRSLHLGALAFWRLFPEPDRSEALRFALCGEGPLSRALALDAPLAGFRVETWSGRDAPGPRQHLEVSCPR